MRAKYIEERFQRYFIFGESEDKVDIATTDDLTVATVSRSEAEKLIKYRDEVIDMLVEVTLALSEKSPEIFSNIWYGGDR